MERTPMDAGPHWHCFNPPEWPIITALSVVIGKRTVERQHVSLSEEGFVNYGFRFTGQIVRVKERKPSFKNHRCPQCYPKVAEESLAHNKS